MKKLYDDDDDVDDDDDDGDDDVGDDDPDRGGPDGSTGGSTGGRTSDTGGSDGGTGDGREEDATTTGSEEDEPAAAAETAAPDDADAPTDSDDADDDDDNDEDDDEDDDDDVDDVNHDPDGPGDTGGSDGRTGGDREEGETATGSEDDEPAAATATAAPDEPEDSDATGDKGDGTGGGVGAHGGSAGPKDGQEGGRPKGWPAVGRQRCRQRCQCCPAASCDHCLVPMLEHEIAMESEPGEHGTKGGTFCLPCSRAQADRVPHAVAAAAAMAEQRLKDATAADLSAAASGRQLLPSADAYDPEYDSGDDGDFDTINDDDECDVSQLELWLGVHEVLRQHPRGADPTGWINAMPASIRTWTDALGNMQRRRLVYYASTLAHTTNPSQDDIRQVVTTLALAKRRLMTVGELGCMQADHRLLGHLIRATTPDLSQGQYIGLPNSALTPAILATWAQTVAARRTTENASARRGQPYVEWLVEAKAYEQL